MEEPPLKPQQVPATIPSELIPLIDARCEQEHYRSRSAYIVGLIVYDLYCRREHKLTARLMSEPQRVRDKVIKQIVEDFLSGERTGRAAEPGWFEKTIAELVEKERARLEEEKKKSSKSKRIRKR